MGCRYLFIISCRAVQKFRQASRVLSAALLCIFEAWTKLSQARFNAVVSIKREERGMRTLTALE